MFENDGLDSVLAATDPLLSDADRFKQRAGAEILAGLLRGALFIRQTRNFINEL
jgi:proteasome activator subunit 4